MNTQPNELILLPTSFQLTRKQHPQFTALETVYSAHGTTTKSLACKLYRKNL